MSTSRLQKRLQRSLMVSWREQPNRYDIEALQANVRRVGLVIKLRWMLITALAVYSLFGVATFLLDPTHQLPILELIRLMVIPAGALLFVVLYNTFYRANYRRLGNIANWNLAQLLLDALVVTVLVYYSGGAVSWFWAVYPLFVLEATFILDDSRSAWVVAAACAILLGAVEILTLFGVFPQIEVPLTMPDAEYTPLLLTLRYLWQVTVLVGTAWVSTALVGEVRSALSQMSGQSITDGNTGLFSRSYFLRALASEVHRTVSGGRSLHVLLIDIDNFSVFNGRFGYEAGDRLLGEIAEGIKGEVDALADGAVSANLAARFGGEEFVVLFAEGAEGFSEGSGPTPTVAAALAERIRAAVSELRVDGAGVTVSVGVASVPQDGDTVDVLLDVADGALARAIDAGGNRVAVAGDAVA